MDGHFGVLSDVSSPGLINIFSSSVFIKVQNSKSPIGSNISQLFIGSNNSLSGYLKMRIVYGESMYNVDRKPGAAMSL